MRTTLYAAWAAGHKWVHLDGFCYRISAPNHLAGMFLLISRGCRPMRCRKMRVYMDTWATVLTPNSGWWRFYRQCERIHTGNESD